MLSNKLKVLVTRAVFPSVIERLAQHFDVESNQDDVLWGREELLRRAEGKDGLFVFGTERVDAELLSHCPRLRIAANMMVGYNNFDIPALNSARVVGTNAPDVLTESTVRSSFLTTPFHPPPSPHPHRRFLHIIIHSSLHLLRILSHLRSNYRLISGSRCCWQQHGGCRRVSTSLGRGVGTNGVTTCELFVTVVVVVLVVLVVVVVVVEGKMTMMTETIAMVTQYFSAL